MVQVKKTDKEIAALEKELSRLRSQRESEAIKAAALKEIIRELKGQLRANKLSVEDLLESLNGSKAKAPAGKKKAGKKAAKKKAPAIKITIPDVGTFKISSRGRLPADLAAFAEKNKLNRAQLVEQFRG